MVLSRTTNAHASRRVLTLHLIYQLGVSNCLHKFCESTTLFFMNSLLVSIGIGPSKVLAKLATRLAKKCAEGFVDLASDPFQRDVLLRSVPVQDLCGIGVRSARKLHQAGIFSAHQLISLPDSRLRSLLRVPGVRLVWELRGFPIFSIEQVPPSPKSISRMRTLGEAVTTLADLQEVLPSFVTRAAEKLRRS